MISFSSQGSYHQKSFPSSGVCRQLRCLAIVPFLQMPMREGPEGEREGPEMADSGPPPCPSSLGFQSPIRTIEVLNLGKTLASLWVQKGGRSVLV